MNALTARKIFSTMPDEVFDIWLRPIIGRIGWPFATEFSATNGTEWHRVAPTLSRIWYPAHRATPVDTAQYALRERSFPTTQP